jgi:drug/metabolite transporter (DMT)-like permease
MATKYKAPLGASLVVLSSFFYASYGIWTKLMGDFFDGYTASVYRSLFVIAILVPIALTARTWSRIEWKRDWLYLAGMIIASCFVWGPLYYAILHIGVGIAVAANYGAMILGMFFFGWLLVHEKFTKDKAVSCFLGCLGLVIIFVHRGSVISLLPLGAAVISGISIAANMVIAKKIPYGGTQSTIILWATSLIANALMVLVFREKSPQFGAHIEWLYLLFFSVASVVASWSFVRGSKLIDVGAAGILGLLEIVFGLLFGIVLFDEQPGGLVIVGALVIIAAAAIPYLKDYNARKGTLE